MTITAAPDIEDDYEKEEDHYEREEEKPVSSLNHSAVQLRLGIALSAFEEVSVFPELSLELPDGQRLTPDLAVYPRLLPNWRHDVVRMKTMPKLAVEIYSPGQGYLEIEEKLNLYLLHGVGSVWVVHPAMQTVAIYLPGVDRPLVFAAGEAKDPALGVTVRLEEIFRLN